MTLWFLGYPEQARQRSHEAITLAQELAHPYTLVYALYNATILHCLRREAPVAQTQAEALIALARQHEFPDRAVRGTVLRGWALAAQGQSTEGIARMHQGMDAYRSMGTNMRPYDLALLAEVSAGIGQTAEALHLLAEALAPLLSGGPERERQIESCSEVAALLRPDGRAPSLAAADAVLRALELGPRRARLNLPPPASHNSSVTAVSDQQEPKS